MDEWIQEGVIAGVPATEVLDWTIGEIKAQSFALNERQRREGQMLAYIAAGEATMLGYCFSDKRRPDIWEVFPFWTEKETRGMRVNKYRAIMERHAAAGGGKHVG